MDVSMLARVLSLRRRLRFLPLNLALEGYLADRGPPCRPTRHQAPWQAVSGQRDLPGYSPTQETEALGLLAVQTYLEGHNGSAETPATTPVGPGWESRRSPR